MGRGWWTWSLVVAVTIIFLFRTPSLVSVPIFVENRAYFNSRLYLNFTRQSPIVLPIVLNSPAYCSLRQPIVVLYASLLFSTPAYCSFHCLRTIERTIEFFFSTNQIHGKNRQMLLVLAHTYTTYNIAEMSLVNFYFK